MKLNRKILNRGGQAWLNLRNSKFDFSLQNKEGGKAV